MPAKSKDQRRLFGIALSYKRGELEEKYVTDEIMELSKLSEKTLKDFAGTPQKNLPKHVKKKSES